VSALTTTLSLLRSPSLSLPLSLSLSLSLTHSLTHTHALSFSLSHTLWQIPKRLIVIGGGPVGVELAQSMAQVGSNVTIIAPTILPGECKEAQEALLGALVNVSGITFVRGRVSEVSSNRCVSVFVPPESLRLCTFQNVKSLSLSHTHIHTQRHTHTKTHTLSLTHTHTLSLCNEYRQVMRLIPGEVTVVLEDQTRLVRKRE